MAKEPRSNANDIVRSFRKIAAQIEPYTDPKLGAYLVELVKNRDAFARFTANPAAALRAEGIDPKLVNTAVLQRVAQSIVDRAGRLRPPDVMDSAASQDTSSYQDKNFDNSSSWVMNKDGYNAIYDAGHSSEKTTSELVGQDHKFETDGVTLHDFGEVFRHEINQLFFPAQPLVSPALVDMIKRAMREGGK
jgi:hypothetical protein